MYINEEKKGRVLNIQGVHIHQIKLVSLHIEHKYGSN